MKQRIQGQRLKKQGRLKVFVCKCGKARIYFILNRVGVVETFASDSTSAAQMLLGSKVNTIKPSCNGNGCITLINPRDLQTYTLIMMLQLLLRLIYLTKSEVVDTQFRFQERPDKADGTNGMGQMNFFASQPIHNKAQLRRTECVLLRGNINQ